MRRIECLAGALVLLAVAILPGCASAGTEKAAATAEPGKEIVGYVSGEPITRADLEEVVAPALKRLEQQRFDTLRAGVEQVALNRMIDKEAAARSMTADQLRESEIDRKIVVPSNEQVAQFYEENKNRAGGRSLEELRPAIVDLMVRSQRQELERVFIDGLKAKNEVRVTLEVPRTEFVVPADRPARGPETAPVTIVEFADFQCPYCRMAHPTVERLLNEYKDGVRYVFMDYVLPNHNRAIPAAQAAACAREQGKFWEYFENLMVMQGSLDDNDLAKRATDLQLDRTEFDACMVAGRYVPQVEKSQEFGQNLGVTGTPTFFINGRMVVGSKSYEELKSVIDEEIARAGAKTAQAGG